MSEPTADNQVVSNVNPQPTVTESVATPAAPSVPEVQPVAVPATPAPSETPKSLVDFFTNRLAGKQEPVQPQPQTQQVATPAQVNPGQQVPPTIPPVTAPSAPQTPDIPDKFKNADGTLNAEALIKSYTNMESMYGKQQSTIQQQQATLQQMSELQNTVIALQQQISARENTAAPPAAQLTPEQLQAKAEADSEAFFEKFNANPLQTLKEAISEAVKPAIEPIRMTQQEIQQERDFQRQVGEWDKQIADVSGKHEDFYDVFPDMQELSKVYGDVISTRSDAIEVLYNLAKSNRAANATPEPVPKPKTQEELLNDPEFIAQLIQNPAVKNLVVQQHMQQIQNSPAPPVIGTQPGGQPPSSAPVNLKDPKEAKKALMAKYAGLKLT